MTDEEKKDQREAVKEGIKEWMTENFTAFGRFTFYGLLIGAFGGMVYLVMVGLGWHK